MGYFYTDIEIDPQYKEFIDWAEEKHCDNAPDLWYMTDDYQEMLDHLKNEMLPAHGRYYKRDIKDHEFSMSVAEYRIWRYHGIEYMGKYTLYVTLYS